MAEGHGLPHTDAQFDYSRARRRQRALAARHAACAASPATSTLILPFDEVVEALGRTGERSLGLADDPARLDRRHGRPRTRLRPRLPADLRPRARALGAHRQRAAPRRGHAADQRLPDRRPALRRDGHHRVSVARALGHDVIDAYVTEVRTEVGAERSIRLGDLPVKSHERLFFERVPLPGRGARAHPAVRSVALRGARRGRRGVGLPGDAGPRRAARRARRSPALVPRRVRPGGRDAARGGPGRRATPRPTPTCASSASATG